LICRKDADEIAQPLMPGLIVLSAIIGFLLKSCSRRGKGAQSGGTIGVMDGGKTEIGKWEDDMVTIGGEMRSIGGEMRSIGGEMRSIGLTQRLPAALGTVNGSSEAEIACRAIWGGQHHLFVLGTSLPSDGGRLRKGSSFDQGVHLTTTNWSKKSS